MFCSDRMSDSHFIMQTSKIVLMGATAMTLDQLRHQKIIQYISPEPYILCSRYLRFSSNGFDMRVKSRCDCEHGGRGRDGNKLKT